MVGDDGGRGEGLEGRCGDPRRRCRAGSVSQWASENRTTRRLNLMIKSTLERSPFGLYPGIPPGITASLEGWCQHALQQTHLARSSSNRSNTRPQSQYQCPHQCQCRCTHRAACFSLLQLSSPHLGTVTGGTVTGGQSLGGQSLGTATGGQSLGDSHWGTVTGGQSRGDSHGGTVTGGQSPKTIRHLQAEPGGEGRGPMGTEASDQNGVAPPTAAPPRP